MCVLVLCLVCVNDKNALNTTFWSNLTDSAHVFLIMSKNAYKDQIMIILELSYPFCSFSSNHD